MNSTLPLPFKEIRFSLGITKTSGLGSRFKDIKEAVASTSTNPLSNILKRHYSLIQYQFNQVKKEIQPWLKKAFKLNPTASGFTEWFIQTRCGHCLNSNKPEVHYEFSEKKPEAIRSMSFKVQLTPDALPFIKPEDIVAYCIYLKNRIEAAYESSATEAIAYSELAEEQINVTRQETYHWAQSPEKLRALHEALLAKEYINCSLEAFQGIFGIADFTGPITWNKSGRELIFFIKILQANRLIEEPSHRYWMLMHHMFLKKEGKMYIPASLKSQNQWVILDGPSQCQKQLLDIISCIN